MGRIVMDGKKGSGGQELGYGKGGIRICCFIKVLQIEEARAPLAGFSSTDWLGSYSII